MRSKNIILIVLVTFLFMSMTPISANIIGEQQNYQKDYQNRLNQINDYKNGKLSYVEKMKIMLQLPKLTAQLNELAQIRNSEAESDDKPHPVPDKVTNKNNALTTEAELKTSRDRVITYSIQQDHGTNVNAVDKEIKDLVIGDIVQIIDKDGYIRYLRYSKLAKNKYYTLSSPRQNFTMSDSEFERTYQGYAIEANVIVVDSKTEEMDASIWTLNTIWADQAGVLATNEIEASRKIDYYHDVEYGTATYIWENFMLYFGMAVTALVAAFGKGILQLFYILYKLIKGQYDVIGGIRGLIRDIYGSRFMFWLTIIAAILLIALSITIAACGIIYKYKYLPAVEPWERSKKEMRDGEANLKEYNTDSTLVFWPVVTTSEKSIVNNSTVNNITSNININGGVLGNDTKV